MQLIENRNMIFKNYKVFQKRTPFSVFSPLLNCSLKRSDFYFQFIHEKKNIAFVDDQSDIWNEETLLRVADFFHANQSGKF